MVPRQLLGYTRNMIEFRLKEIRKNEFTFVHKTPFYGVSFNAIQEHLYHFTHRETKATKRILSYGT
jgi:hypothetical protein